MTADLITLPERHAPMLTDHIVRLGGAGDGGYLIDARAIPETKLAIGLGMFFDWRFEKELAEKAQCPVEMYDFSVTTWRFAQWLGAGAARYLARQIDRQAFMERVRTYKEFRSYFDGKRHTHVLARIGRPSDGCTGLTEVVGTRSGIFLKVDIEGAEYDILDEIVALRDRFSGVVIEFHDFWTHRDAIVAFLDSIDFTVGHWHVNTSVVPNRATGAGVIEVTLTPHPGEGRRTDLHPLDDVIPGTEALTEVTYG